MNEIEAMCEEIIILKAGRIMTQGKISALLHANESKSLETLFLEN